MPGVLGCAEAVVSVGQGLVCMVVSWKLDNFENHDVYHTEWEESDIGEPSPSDECRLLEV